MEIPTKFKEALTDINEKKISEIDDEVKKLHLKINEINARIEYLENVKAVIMVNQKLDNRPELMEDKFYELQQHHFKRTEEMVNERNQLLQELINKVDKLTEAVIRLRKD